MSCAVSACSVATPQASTPAPDLPADSVSYDTLPVQTVRKMPFTNDCSQVASVSDFAGFQTFQSQGKNLGCALTANYQTITAFDIVEPSHDIADPWHAYWNGDGHHFRRVILNKKYWAVMWVPTYKSECDIVINTGSTSVLFGSQQADTTSTPNYDDITGWTALANQTCPKIQNYAEKLLAAADPQGGSLAIN